MDTDTDREMDVFLKALSHRIVQTGKFEICKAARQARNPGKRQYWNLNLKAVCRLNFFFLSDFNLF